MKFVKWLACFETYVYLIIILRRVKFELIVYEDNCALLKGRSKCQGIPHLHLRMKINVGTCNFRTFTNHKGARKRKQII